MATNITISNLLPITQSSTKLSVMNDIYNTTFVGIDFGTSTTVASISYIDEGTGLLKVETIRLNQRMLDGAIVSSEKIPTLVAYKNGKLLFGEGASALKFDLVKNKNIWHSFKMELGEDLGAKYYYSELANDEKYRLRDQHDAARLFFKFLSMQINKYVEKHNLPKNIKYAVSVPASFEANQRQALVNALEQNGMQINKQALIDEPNAAFLSYVQTSSYENNAIRIPENDNPKLLVFDFGAGTCDISILELGSSVNGVYSKNIAISRFCKLGGDNIDQLIAVQYLYPQLLRENNLKENDFKTAEKQRIIAKLLKYAELLKIKICDNIALKMAKRTLPEQSNCGDVVALNKPIEVDTRLSLLTLSVPQLSYSEFNEAMNSFLNVNKLSILGANYDDKEFISIYSPINSALKKANLSKNDIDYVLFIGGSSKNPYVQASLNEFFKGSEIIVPRDLQTHVSAGTAIHSLIYNGYNKNIIQPITSEPIIVITKDVTNKVLLRAGTQIPCDLMVIDDLVVARNNQPAVELPICLGNANKMLYNLKVVSESRSGFEKGSKVLIELELNADKLLVARATVNGKSAMVKPMNPFANKELTSLQKMVLNAEREANNSAVANGGICSEKALRNLYKAYEQAGDSLKAAETYELMYELYPNAVNINNLGVLYSDAGNNQKALEYYKKSYERNKDAANAFNYAYGMKHTDRDKYKQLLEESVRLDSSDACHNFELGRAIKNDDTQRSEQLINKAFETWQKKYAANNMADYDYGWFSCCAEYLQMYDLAREIIASKPDFKIDDEYDSDNLAVSSF